MMEAGLNGPVDLSCPLQQVERTRKSERTDFDIIITIVEQKKGQRDL